MSRKRSPRHRLIDVLAARWVVRRFGPGDKYGTKRDNREAIAAFMRNWLCQHGSLPSGTHKVKLPGAQRRSDGVKIPRAARPWLIVDFDRLMQGDLHYPESYSAEVHRLRALRPGDRVEFRSGLPEDRKRHGVKGTVVELDLPKGWAVVDLDNGEKTVCASGQKLFTSAAGREAVKRVVMTPLRDMAYMSGYCMMRRGEVIEIWHYASDQFKGTEPTWKAAYDWAIKHSTIARLPKKTWPYAFYGEDAPISWVDWPEADSE